MTIMLWKKEDDFMFVSGLKALVIAVDFFGKN